MKEILDLCVGDLFSFRKDSVVYMVTRKSLNHMEYKSYNDGKIRVVTMFSKLNREVYLRNEFDKTFSDKWFGNIWDDYDKKYY